MIQICYGATYFQYTVVSSSRQTEFFHGVLQQVPGFRAEFAVFADEGLGHAGIAGDPWDIFESLELLVAAWFDASPHGSRAFPECGGPKFLHSQSGGLDVDVDAIEQGTAYPCPGAMDLGHGAAALPG